MTEQERWHAFLASSKTGQLLDWMLRDNARVDADLARVVPPAADEAPVPSGSAGMAAKRGRG